MKKHLFVVVLIVLALVIAGLAAWLAFGSKLTGQQGNQSTGTDEAADIVVTRTPEGYEPKEITIKQGDVVEWKNESGEFHWPASDLHPTHGVYPEFDPLRPIADGESWKFKFDKVGVWKYHDHIRANKVGTVTVQ